MKIETTKRVLIVSGATATGKTSLAIDLACNLKETLGITVEIVNFDSLSFYRELLIGTARPDKEEQRGIPHHLMGIVSIAQSFNAADFVKLGRMVVNKIHSRGAWPLLVGGSGFYLRALIKGMWKSAPVSEEVRQQVQELYQKEGIAGVITVLRERDEDYLTTVHINDHYRLLRAVEHLFATGQTVSQARKGGPENPYDFAHSEVQDWKVTHIHLTVDRAKHENIIRQRVEKMLQKGLVEEVEMLLGAGFNGMEKALGSVGYKEVVEYLQKKREEKKVLAEKIVISTRQLAKAQKTFFKKISPRLDFISQDREQILQAISRG